MSTLQETGDEEMIKVGRTSRGKEEDIDTAMKGTNL